MTCMVFMQVGEKRRDKGMAAKGKGEGMCMRLARQ